jgi:hypothetical protein
MIHEGCFKRLGSRKPLLPGGMIAVVVAMMGLVAGCSSRSAVDVAKVSGTVTLDGKPLPDAVILFQPKGGRPSHGQTGPDGTYQLLYTIDRAGAMVGTSTVTISTAIEDNDGNVALELVPKRYFQPGAITVEVKPRKNVINFDLTTKPGG